MELSTADTRGAYLGVRARAVEIAGVSRPAVEASAPSRVIFRDFAVAKEGCLSLGIGVGMGVSTPVRFTARLGEVLLWSSVISRPEGWNDALVDLGPFAGQSHDLVFETEPMGAATAVAYWSGLRYQFQADPALLPPQRLVDQQTSLLPLLELDEQGVVRRGRVAPGVGAEMEVIGRCAGPSRSGESTPLTFEVIVDGIPRVAESFTGLTAGSFRAVIPLERDGSIPIEMAVRCDDPPCRGHFQSARVRTFTEVPHQRHGASLLLIVVDTLRADVLGAWGSPDPHSAHLDRLSRQGRLYENAIAQSSWTVPSMASLFSGHYPGHPPLSDVWALPAEAEVVAEKLQRQGWSTVALVANPLLSRVHGWDQGFGDYVHVPETKAMDLVELFELWRSLRAEHRWFAYLHFLDPHDPYAPPPPWSHFVGAGAAGLEVAPLAQSLRNDGDAASVESRLDGLERAYAGEVMYWDAGLARLLARLRSTAPGRPTRLLLLSDHGEEFLEHGRLTHGNNLYAESVRVPLLVRDGSLPRLLSRAWELREVPRLLGDILGVAGFEGGPRVPRGAASRLVQRFRQRDAGNRETLSVMEGRWKYVRTFEGEQLYDTAADPAEQNDVADQHPDVVARLRRRADALHRPVGDEAESAADPTDPQTRDQLRALGYLP